MRADGAGDSVAKMRRVYLPKWIRAFVFPLLVLLWGFATYQAFYTEQGRAEMGAVGWLVVTLVFLLIGAMLWLMSSRKLPAYLIEEDDEETR
ncbi:MAG: hypothetical protein ACREKI_00210 [Gemmatimonadota bacterium]